MSSTSVVAAHTGGFDHEALIYDGEDGFLAGTVPFIREGVEADEPVFVVVSRERIAALRSVLGAVSEAVAFADMAEVGANPARIIPAWWDFLDHHGVVGGRAARGIGEPIWVGRSGAELVECERHEMLLNLAFANSGPWKLRCPYDVGTLPPTVIEEARRNHPVVVEGQGERTASGSWRTLDEIRVPFAAPLRPAPPTAAGLAFGPGDLPEVRRFATVQATVAGLVGARVEEVILVVHEVAANSLVHGGGAGLVRAWTDGASLLFEIVDSGRIEDPLVGRQLPSADDSGGRGMWLANQLCDLVQIRTFPGGNAVRLHIRTGSRADRVG